MGLPDFLVVDELTRQVIEFRSIRDLGDFEVVAFNVEEKLVGVGHLSEDEAPVVEHELVVGAGRVVYFGEDGIVKN